MRRGRGRLARRHRRRGEAFHLRFAPRRRACPTLSARSSHLPSNVSSRPPLGSPGLSVVPPLPPLRFGFASALAAVFRAFADFAAAPAASPSRSRTKLIHASFGAGRGAALSLVSAFSTSAAKDAHASLTSGVASSDTFASLRSRSRASAKRGARRGPRGVRGGGGDDADGSRDGAADERRDSSKGLSQHAFDVDDANLVEPIVRPVPVRVADVLERIPGPLGRDEPRPERSAHVRHVASARREAHRLRSRRLFPEPSPGQSRRVPRRARRREGDVASRLGSQIVARRNHRQTHAPVVHEGDGRSVGAPREGGLYPRRGKIRQRNQRAVSVCAHEVQIRHAVVRPRAHADSRAVRRGPGPKRGPEARDREHVSLGRATRIERGIVVEGASRPGQSREESIVRARQSPLRDARRGSTPRSNRP